MKRLWILALFSVGCAHVGLQQEGGLTPTNASIHLVGRFGVAHGCVVTDHVALTAAHVVDLKPFEADVPLKALRWSDDQGGNGVAVPMGVQEVADLGLLWSVAPFSTPAVVAAEAPAVGSEVRITGYDWRSPDKAFSRRVWTSRVARVVASHVILSDPAEGARRAPAFWIPRVESSGDAMVDAMPLGDSLIIYKETSCYSMNYIGGTYIWQCRKLPIPYGMLSANCGASIPMGHIAFLFVEM